jgi:hypothetical protein
VDTFPNQCTVNKTATTILPSGLSSAIEATRPPGLTHRNAYRKPHLERNCLQVSDYVSLVTPGEMNYGERHPGSTNALRRLYTTRCITTSDPTGMAGG